MHLDLLVQEGVRYIAAIERADPGAVVPTCPEWTLRELVHHTGGVHRWATRIVTERATAPIAEELETIAGGWPDDQDLAPWFRAGHALLCDALRAAPDDIDVFHFFTGPSPLIFWQRRQLHETTIHRVDAELVSGPVSPISVAHAVDGIDEMLTGFLPRRSSKLRPSSPTTLAVQPTDSDAGWVVSASQEPSTTSRERAEGDVVLRGPAADLYLLLWNRRSLDGLDVEGDASLLDQWRSNVTIRWS
jgi:uncharacterized protein (TIGR03083 family)